MLVGQRNTGNGDVPHSWNPSISPQSQPILATNCGNHPSLPHCQYHREARNVKLKAYPIPLSPFDKGRERTRHQISHFGTFAHEAGFDCPNERRLSILIILSYSCRFSTPLAGDHWREFVCREGRSAVFDGLRAGIEAGAIA